MPLLHNAFIESLPRVPPTSLVFCKCEGFEGRQAEWRDIIMKVGSKENICNRFSHFSKEIQRIQIRAEVKCRSVET
jgi:hypothetical protein